VLEDSARKKEIGGRFSRTAAPPRRYTRSHQGDDARRGINLQVRRQDEPTCGRDTFTRNCQPGHMRARPKKRTGAVAAGVHERQEFSRPYAIISTWNARSGMTTEAGNAETLIIIKLDGEKSRVVGSRSREGEDRETGGMRTIAAGRTMSASRGASAAKPAHRPTYSSATHKQCNADSRRQATANLSEEERNRRTGFVRPRCFTARRLASLASQNHRRERVAEHESRFSPLQ